MEWAPFSILTRAPGKESSKRSLSQSEVTVQGLDRF